MKALVVYDSFFGNTEKIALAIGEALGSAGEVRVAKVDQVTPDQLKGLDVLLVGSPTRAFQPSPNIKAFLKAIPGGSLKGLRVAAFDTRAKVDEVNSGFLTFMVKLFGYAAEPMAKQLVKKGGTQAVPPAGFFVDGTEGPLKEGELERAAAWGRQAV